MTGPEHYKRAESLLNAINDGGRQNKDLLMVWAAEAQVHATLALAAATAAHQANIYDGDESHSRTRGWAGVV